ncbi:amidase [Telluribacter sp. SYSU D00476]|uniref:amidase n=1 Tax=Telluribacter sp. SYSU D00476 TaxID=2811430 RepID=UPI001FF4802B|nr:amidase [Telluribacter sp. SYSU D00476]
MTTAEYLNYDAIGLAQLVRQGDVTPRELLNTALAIAEKVNPRINAIIHPLYEEGYKMVEELPAEAPLRGVPFLLKDLALEWAGTPMRSGNKAYYKYVSSVDSYYVERCRAAGLVFFGKTNTPEFGLNPFTEPTAFGPSHNPWNLDYSTGGSSGGSAAAVAAGIVPAATASDGGGSIRIPASCCGLFGLKPTRGRVSLGPHVGEAWGGAVVSGSVTRTVRDSALLLDLLSGYAPGDPYVIQAPERPYLQEVDAAPEKLRIGFSTQHPLSWHKVDADCVRAVEKAARLLMSLGHEVEEVSIPFNPEMFLEAFLPVFVGETSAALRHLSKWLGRPIQKGDVEMNTWLIAKLGEVYTAADYAHAQYRWNELSRTMATFHQQYDLLLTPVMARPPIRIGELQNNAQENMMLKLLQTTGGYSFLKGSKVVEQVAERTFSYIPYTTLANMTGQPSMSIPMHWTQNNLPIGVMFTGRMGEESLMFRLAAQLEQAQPWAHQRPNLM